MTANETNSITVTRDGNVTEATIRKNTPDSRELIGRVKIDTRRRDFGVHVYTTANGQVQHLATVEIDLPFLAMTYDRWETPSEHTESLSEFASHLERAPGGVVSRLWIDSRASEGYSVQPEADLVADALIGRFLGGEISLYDFAAGMYAAFPRVIAPSSAAKRLREYQDFSAASGAPASETYCR